jgi:hypothetical protein
MDDIFPAFFRCSCFFILFGGYDRVMHAGFKSHLWITSWPQLVMICHDDLSNKPVMTTWPSFASRWERHFYESIFYLSTVSSLFFFYIVSWIGRLTGVVQPPKHHGKVHQCTDDLDAYGTDRWSIQHFGEVYRGIPFGNQSWPMEIFNSCRFLQEKQSIHKYP